MAINLYTGLQGSGKSYECVSTVMVEAVANGRRVVTNVDGIDSEEIRMYVHEKRGISFDQLGHVDHCENEDVLKPDFFYYGDQVDTFVRPGDLVCIDEAWRFWGTDSKIHPNHFTFFREHRHYVNPDTKVSCDLAVMVQDISDLHRKLKYVVELHCRTTKLKSLGFNKTYRVELWEGYKTAAKLKLKTEVKKYDKDVFPLYSSYAGGEGKEATMDFRQNVLNSKKLWFGIIAALICLYISITQTIKFFSPKTASTSGAKVTASNGATTAANQPATPLPPTYSSEYRIVGNFKGRDGSWVVVQDSKGRTRLESPTIFNEPNSILATGTIDGQRVSLFSGAALNSTFKEAVK
jgi:zona occludens toxin